MPSHFPTPLARGRHDLKIRNDDLSLRLISVRYGNQPNDCGDEIGVFVSVRLPQRVNPFGGWSDQSIYKGSPKADLGAFASSSCSCVWQSFDHTSARLTLVTPIRAKIARTFQSYRPHSYFVCLLPRHHRLPHVSSSKHKHNKLNNIDNRHILVWQGQNNHLFPRALLQILPQ